MTRELRIGIFLGGVILILAVFVFVVGDMSVLLKKPGFALVVDIDTAAGLDKRAAVKMAGVQIGFVKAIRLAGRRAEVVLSVYPDTRIPRDSRATLSTLGLLGEKYVEILPGESATFCRPGEVLAGLPSAGFDQIGTLLVSLGNDLKEAGGALKEMLGPEARTSVKQTLDNLAVLSAELRDLIGGSQKEVHQTVQSAGRAFENLDNSAGAVSAAARDALRQLQDLAAENRESIRLNLDKIKDLIGQIQDAVNLMNASLEKIKRGEGTVGKMIQEPELYDKAKEALDAVRQTARSTSSLRALMDVQADRYGRSGLVRSSYTLGLWFNPKVFFTAGLIRNPWEGRFTFSLQSGFRLGDFVPRAGFIESEFGLGLDYSAFRNRLVFSLEGFDFNRAPSPHLRAATRIEAFRYFYFVLGLDDFSLASRRELYFGLGMTLR
jgi:phospholipid/cholesterol/gamma-HCH transport system substrate-binding protein